MFDTFLKDETGAVTVEWVVLTSVLVGMGIAVMNVVSSGVEDLATDIEAYLANIPIMTSFEEWDEFRENGVVIPEDTPEEEEPQV